LKEKELSTALMALYHMWLARNDARDEQMIEDPDKTAQRILVLVEEWLSLKSPAPQPVQKENEHWLPPADGWYKVNADGALNPKEGHGGGGVIIRDHHGIPQAGACHFFPRVTDPERAELLACRHAVNLAKELGMRKIALETDCSGVVAKLQASDKNRSIHGPLVEEIKASLGELDDFRVLHVRRSGNAVAHKLAKDGCMNKCCNRWVSWVESLPDFVLNLAALNMGN
jgi:ribonuclease HI